MDELFEFQNNGSQMKLSQLQKEIEKLQCETSAKRDFLRVQKEILAQQDQEMYIATMKEIEAAFMEQRKHLHMEIKCTCEFRKFKCGHHYARFSCPAIWTVMKELEEQGYLPECKAEALNHDNYNVKHIIDCEL